MKNKTKKRIRDKARLAYGITNILKNDIDNLRIESRECDVSRLDECIFGIVDSLEKLVDVMSDLDYIVHLHKVDNAKIPNTLMEEQ